jgi:hypothetical protein
MVLGEGYARCRGAAACHHVGLADPSTVLPLRWWQRRTSRPGSLKAQKAGLEDQRPAVAPSGAAEQVGARAAGD